MIIFFLRRATFFLLCKPIFWKDAVGCPYSTVQKSMISAGCYTSRVRRHLKDKTGKEFKKFLEEESSRMWRGVYMVMILLTSLIWWDHPHLFNHFSLSYIINAFSWKRLRTVNQSWVKDCWKNMMDIVFSIVYFLFFSEYLFAVDTVQG